MRTSARERKVFDLIKQGMPDNTITLLTGYSRAVIQAMRKDLERMERDIPTSKDTQYRKGDKVTFNGRHYTCVKNNVSSSPDEDPKSWQLAE